jgi:hypothetical protein
MMSLVEPYFVVIASEAKQSRAERNTGLLRRCAPRNDAEKGRFNFTALETRMAWFLNLYKCERCRRRWADEWSCMCDDTCPHCGARDMTPYESEELTTLIEEEGKEFVVLWSPETAEHEPDYRELGRFPSREKALEFLSADG